MERLRNLLSSAIRRDKHKCAACLLDLGVPLDWQDLGSMASLHQAAELGNVMTLRLMTNRLPVDREDAQGETALHVACRNLRSEAVEVLVEAGADPERRDAQGRNAMDHARRGVADSTFDPNWWEKHYGENEVGPFESIEDAYARICAALVATERSAGSDPSRS